MAAAGLIAIEGVDAHQLGELEEVRNAAGFFQALIQVIAAAGDVDVLPVLLLQRANLANGGLKTLGGARHAAVVPHNLAQLAVEGIDRALAFDGKQQIDGLLDAGDGLA